MKKERLLNSIRISREKTKNLEKIVSEKSSHISKFLSTSLLSLACLFNPLTNIVDAASVSLAWDSPKTNYDGTSLTSSIGYKLYYGNKSGAYTMNVDVGNVTTDKVDNLSTGIPYCFVVTCYETVLNADGSVSTNADGSTIKIESAPSKEVTFMCPYSITGIPIVVDINNDGTNVNYTFAMSNRSAISNINTITGCRFAYEKEGGGASSVTSNGTNQEEYLATVHFKPGNTYNISASFKYFQGSLTNLETSPSPKINISLAAINTAVNNLGLTLDPHPIYTTNPEINLTGTVTGNNPLLVNIIGDTTLENSSLSTINSTWGSTTKLKNIGINILYTFVKDNLGRSSPTNAFCVVYDPGTDTDGDGQTDVQEMLMGGKFMISGANKVTNGFNLEFPTIQAVEYVFEKKLSLDQKEWKSVTNLVASANSPKYSLRIQETNQTVFYRGSVNLESLIQKNYSEISR